MGEIPSGFKTQDIDGKIKMVKDVAFADDLISVTGNLEGLQQKADVMGAWCVITGVEIATKKLRTFGKEWGMKKVEGRPKHIEIIMKGNVRKK